MEGQCRLIIIVILVALMEIRNISSIIAYDCADASNNLTYISLSSMKMCKDTNKTVAVVKNETMIKVYQLDQVKHISVISCLIEARHLITRCGKTIDTRFNKGYYSEVINLPLTDCKNLHNTGRLDGRIYGLGGIFEHLVINIKNNKAVVTHGSIDGDGSCTPGLPLTIGDNYYDRPIRESSITITYRITDGILDYSNAKVKMADGYYCNFYDYTCFTTGLGNNFWNNLITGKVCADHSPVSLLYSGPAVKTTHYSDQTIVSIFSFTNGETDFAIGVKKEDKYCGYIKILQSEHPLVFITEGTTNSILDTEISPPDAKNIDIITHVNSKLLYIVRHVKGQIENLYSLLLEDRCNSEMKRLRQLQTTGYISPNQFAYDYYGTPGYSARISGEVIYITKCKPVSVTYSPVTEKCYQEIPVSYNNKTQFIQPRTKLLSKLGTEIDCNPLMRPYYNIDGKWVSPTGHELILTNSPVELQPSLLGDWEFILPKNIIGSGLYSQKTIESYRKSLELPDSQQTVLSNLASKTLDWTDGDHIKVDIVSSISEEQLMSLKNRLMYDTLRSWWDKICSLGAFSSGLWIIYIFAKFLYSLVVNIMILKGLNTPKHYYLMSPMGRLITYLTNKKREESTEARFESTNNQLNELRSILVPPV